MNSNPTLVQLFDKYKCDKGSLKHRYDRVYGHALDQLRNEKFNMLEIGVFKGNSTEAFIEYCPHVEIVALDIFERVEMEQIKIPGHERVDGYAGSSMEPIYEDSNIFQVFEEGFDIIIDDGLHTHEAQRKTFDNLFQYLKEGGSYFIEDVWPYHIMSEKEKEHYWLVKHAPAFSNEEYKKLMAAIRPYHVFHHDLRKGFEPDTYIIEVKK